MAVAERTPADVASYLAVSQATVSKILNGRQATKVAQVRSILQLCGASPEVTEDLVELARAAAAGDWWSDYGAPEWFRTFLGLEGAADSLLTYEGELVPGLLQTAAYVEAITRRAHPEMGDDEVKRSVELRLARQQHLASDGRTPRLHFVLNEAVTCRPVGGPSAWREQLEHLIAMADAEHVTLQVLLFSAGAHPVMGSAFTVLEFDSEPTLSTVYLENDRGGSHLKSRSEIDRYRAVFSDLVASAASPAASRALLVRVAEHW
ncbi:hypothetical protein Amir_1626 [Actinosynnema mirum DSM 43827]|uniref:DUF5753 domain-containing protein n=2 Tax=Actinosynnema mirum TaxID=40567 RepID=C6WBK7_ACTMD|nr:hypothetical protein Amir_1626 [Actinosynnema mirum DSM 43827]